MGDGNNVYVLFPGAIYVVVWEPTNNPLSIAAAKRCACVGIGKNALRRLLERGEKAEPKPRKAHLI